VTPSPFFILGSGRCGSTWVHMVLQQHPHIALTNEAGVLDFLNASTYLATLPRPQLGELPTSQAVTVRGIVHEDHVAAFGDLYVRHAKEMCEAFYRQLFAGKDFKWWGDKLPDPRAACNAMRIWPDVRYLLLVRDPRDVLCSWRAHGRKPRIAGMFPELQTMRAEELPRSWDSIYRGALDALGDAALLVRYRDLCRQPREKMAAMLAFLGLDWTDEVEQAFVGNDSFAEHGTAADPAASVGRWQRELDAADLDVVLTFCGETMQRLGYEVGN
jgi:protein-tyrosine sulfotransferase